MAEHTHYYSVLVYPPRRSWLWRFFNPTPLPRLHCKCGEPL